MDTEKTLALLRQELQPALDELKAEIVEFTLKRAGRKLILRLLIDKEGGINIDECAVVNRRIGDIIEEKNLMDERYLLEVSSPGLDRPLKTKADFERIQGEEIELWLSQPVEGQPYLSGKAKSADEQNVIIEDKDAKEISVAYELINKARLKLT